VIPALSRASSAALRAPGSSSSGSGREALIAELDATPAAAISHDYARTVADPFPPTAELTVLLRMQARSPRVERGAGHIVFRSPPSIT
jgi:hypothetical protein